MLFIKPTVSHDKDYESRDTTAYCATCLFAEKKSGAILIKTQLFSLSWTYLIYGAWGSKSCISVLFALPIGTQKTLFFNPLLQVYFIDTTDHMINSFLLWNSS